MAHICKLKTRIITISESPEWSLQKAAFLAFYPTKNQTLKENDPQDYIAEAGTV